MIRVLKRRFINPLAEFFNDSRAIGIMLLLCTAVSLIIANTPAGPGYLSFWKTEIELSAFIHLPHSLIHWINDGLMAVFFFLVGMEIKRELLHGELSSLRKTMLPAAAAVGGMAAPAAIYLLFNSNSTLSGGWGVPTATDIAFSLGIASLLGKKVPLALKVFLTALAIIDDLGAILVIAIFYGEQIHLVYLFSIVIISLLIVVANKFLSRFGLVQIILGLILWYVTFNSGIHATVAGVIFAFLVPAKFLTDLENKIHHPVYFIIMPLFALANTAIVFPSGGLNVLNSAMPLGIMLALVIGKPAGITIASWILVKLKLADLPTRTNWLQLIGAGILAGIGFTMSIFIATLAFNTDETEDVAKLAVLVSSVVAMLAGYFWLTLTYKKVKRKVAK